MEGSSSLQLTAVTDGDTDGNSGDGGAAAPAIEEGGGVVGEVQRLEGGVGVVSVELGNDGGDRADSDGSLVCCTSGERRSARGRRLQRFLGDKRMSGRCEMKWRCRWRSLEVEGWLTGGDELQRRRRDAFGEGVGGGGFWG